MRSVTGHFCDPKEGGALPGRFFFSRLKVSQGSHAAAKTSARLQDGCSPPFLGAACQMLQQEAGSAPARREYRARLQQLDAKGNDPQRGLDKMQGPGNLFHIHAGQENWGRSEGPPPKRNACQKPTVISMLCLRAGGAGAGSCHKPCPWQSS